MEESRNAVVLTCLLIYFALCIGVGHLGAAAHEVLP